MDYIITNWLFLSLTLFVIFRFFIQPFTVKTIVKSHIFGEYNYRIHFVRNFSELGSLIFLLTSIALFVAWISLEIINEKVNTLLIDKDAFVFVQEIDLLTNNLTYGVTNGIIVLPIILLVFFVYIFTKNSLKKKCDTTNDRLQRKLIDGYSTQINDLQHAAYTEGKEKTLNLLIVTRDGLVSNLTQSSPKGLLRALKIGNSGVFVIGILLLVFTLVNAGAEFVSNDIKNKISLIDSRIVSTGFKKITSYQNESGDQILSSEDEQALNKLSRFFETNIIASRIFGNTAVISTGFSETRNYSVRAAILDQLASANHSVKTHDLNNSLTTVNSNYATKHIDEEGKLTTFNNAIERQKKAISNDEPITTLGRRIKKDLKEIAIKNADLWRHYKKLVIKPKKKILFSQSLNNMLISDAIANYADEHSFVDQFYTNESKRYMLELSRSKDINNVENKIKDIQYRTFIPAQYVRQLRLLSVSYFDTEQIKSILDAKPPSLMSNVEPHVKINSASRTVQRIASMEKTSNSRDFADALSKFEDYFPGHQGEERLTTKGVLTSKNLVEESKVAFLRSRNYTKLRGFSRIGGVLIGRMPEGDENITEVVNIKWKKEGDNVLLTLVLNDEREVNIGKFNRSIVHLALGYAADSRPTTVTMVTSRPLAELRILLHPALVDTSLGCNAIKLDQIVDEITSNDNQIKKIRDRERVSIADADALYKFTWSLWLKSIVLNSPFIAEQIPSEFISYADELAGKYFIKVEEIISREPNINFLQSKLDFYDKNLVQIIERCQNADLGYNMCAIMSLTAQERFSGSVISAPPTTIEWSGVREQKYSLDKSLNFLLLDKHDSLWPLRFMVQRVFTTTPAFASNKKDYADITPWEFVSINTPLTKEINNQILNKQDWKLNVDNMRKFAVLQRLFRVALNNKFNNSFPLEKLVILARETKPSLSKYNRTLRWLAAPEDVLQNAQNDPNIEKLFLLKGELRKDLGIKKDRVQIEERKGGSCPPL